MIKLDIDGKNRMAIGFTFSEYFIRLGNWQRS